MTCYWNKEYSCRELQTEYYTTIYSIRGTARKTRMSSYGFILLPTRTYGCESLGLTEDLRKKIETSEMGSLSKFISVNRMDKMRSERIRNNCK